MKPRVRITPSTAGGWLVTMMAEHLTEPSRVLVASAFIAEPDRLTTTVLGEALAQALGDLLRGITS